MIIKYIYQKYVYIVLLLFLFVCCNDSSGIKKQAQDFIATPIHVPYEQLDKRFCSLFSDSTESLKSIKMVYYVDSVSCTACEINKMALIDSKKRELYPDVEFLYIINVNPSNVDAVYSTLCNSRIVSPVYLDTLNSFLTVNPHIPKSKLFHSFVMNDKDSVLMVGSPFSSPRLESLFVDIIKKYK